MNQKNSNVLKSKFLGVNHSTANGRLRKLILFSLVQRLNEDICFKCNNKIDTVDELSIEHKIPWLNNKVELFWDLDNIAFSHLECNRPHVNHGRKKVRLNGHLQCCNCLQFKDEIEFSKSLDRPCGRRSNCKKCVIILDSRKNHSKQHNYGRVSDK